MPTRPQKAAGPSYGAGGIFAEGGGAEEGGGGPAGAAAGGAGVAGQVPRVAGASVGVVEGVAHGELAHVELAQQHGPGIFQLSHDRGVVVRHEVAQDFRAAGGGDARGAELVLDGVGYAVQGAAIVA